MERKQLPPKVLAAFKAVVELFTEGADLNTLTVSEITTRAGIGKGTVYDYFANKEEMLAGALYHGMDVVCWELYERLEKKKNLYEKMEQILFDMETNKQEMECAFKVLHLLMDNSQVSKQLRELFREKKDNELPLYQMLQKLIQEELGEGSGISQEDTLYLVMNTMSKLVCYAMYLNYDGVMSVYGTKKIRERICRAICQEVENVERVEGSADKNID